MITPYDPQEAAQSTPFDAQAVQLKYLQSLMNQNQQSTLGFQLPAITSQVQPLSWNSNIDSSGIGGKFDLTKLIEQNYDQFLLDLKGNNSRQSDVLLDQDVDGSSTNKGMGGMDIVNSVAGLGLMGWGMYNQSRQNKVARGQLGLEKDKFAWAQQLHQDRQDVGTKNAQDAQDWLAGRNNQTTIA